MAKSSFFFYDLETSGFNPRSARVMQFAGQRTDMELQPVGEPVNLLIKLSPDVLPDPDAIFVTGITPQQTLADGLTEAEFLKPFYDEVVRPGTIFMGFNSIRFDDEFMRFMMYRNFYDAYEWEWQDDASRWDLLDVVRMTRALRPEGIEWPFAPDGRPANRLEFLTRVNKLDHDQAHDALSDVRATIAVARLIRAKHPELFEYLLTMRNKKKVEELVLTATPFVYTSGHYPIATLHTTVTTLLVKHPQPGSALVYDLRHDPTPFLEMNVEQLADVWKFNRDPEAPPRLPVKTIKFNHCPAVAPLGVIKAEATQARIGLTLATIAKHQKILQKHQADFAQKILKVVALLDAAREKEQTTLVTDEQSVDSRLYEKFIDNRDKALMRAARAAPPQELSEFVESFHDERLKSLLPLYKARNYPASLDSEERAAWEAFCARRLYAGGETSRLAKYFERLQELADGKLTTQQQYVLEELRLYGQSIVPAELS